MKHFKKIYSGEGEYEKREYQLNMFAAFLGGAIGSGLTNAFDVLTINKQTNPDINLWKLVKAERFNLMTKGLLARVYYNSMQSIVFFGLVLYIGKIYDVQLADEWLTSRSVFNILISIIYNEVHFNNFTPKWRCFYWLLEVPEQKVRVLLRRTRHSTDPCGPWKRSNRRHHW